MEQEQYNDGQPQTIVEIPHGVGSPGHPSQPGPQYKRGRGRSFFKEGPSRGGCQVPGCDRSLADLKEYYKRYKICQYHLELSCMVVEGQAIRFCQQCGHFQLLDDFDGDRRSCRKKLEKHNGRRKLGRRLDHMLASNIGNASESDTDGGGRHGGSGRLHKMRRVSNSDQYLSGPSDSALAIGDILHNLAADFDFMQQPAMHGGMPPGVTVGSGNGGMRLPPNKYGGAGWQQTQQQQQQQQQQQHGGNYGNRTYQLPPHLPPHLSQHHHQAYPRPLPPYGGPSLPPMSLASRPWQPAYCSGAGYPPPPQQQQQQQQQQRQGVGMMPSYPRPPLRPAPTPAAAAGPSAVPLDTLEQLLRRGGGGGMGWGPHPPPHAPGAFRSAFAPPGGVSDGRAGPAPGYRTPQLQQRQGSNATSLQGMLSLLQQHLGGDSGGGSSKVAAAPTRPPPPQLPQLQQNSGSFPPPHHHHHEQQQQQGPSPAPLPRPPSTQHVATAAAAAASAAGPEEAVLSHPLYSSTATAVKEEPQDDAQRNHEEQQQQQENGGQQQLDGPDMDLLCLLSQLSQSAAASGRQHVGPPPPQQPPPHGGDPNAYRYQ